MVEELAFSLVQSPRKKMTHKGWERGSFDPIPGDGLSQGRLYSTGMNLLTLQVAKRALIYSMDE